MALAANPLNVAILAAPEVAARNKNRLLSAMDETLQLTPTSLIIFIDETGNEVFSDSNVRVSIGVKD